MLSSRPTPFLLFLPTLMSFVITSASIFSIRIFTTKPTLTNLPFNCLTNVTEVINFRAAIIKAYCLKQIADLSLLWQYSHKDSWQQHHCRYGNDGKLVNWFKHEWLSSRLPFLFGKAWWLHYTQKHLNWQRILFLGSKWKSKCKLKLRILLLMFWIPLETQKNCCQAIYRHTK